MHSILCEETTLVNIVDAVHNPQLPVHGGADASQDYSMVTTVGNQVNGFNT